MYPLGSVSSEILTNTAMQADYESLSDCKGWCKVSVDFPVVKPEDIKFVLLSFTNLVFKTNKQTKRF